MTQDALNLTPVSTQDAGVITFAGSCGLPPQARVRAKAEFTQVFETGKRVAEPLMALHWLHDTHAPRIGLAVSRKVDPNAVGRNRIKRVLRDAFRHLRPQLRPGAYVIVARAAARQADNVALRDLFRSPAQARLCIAANTGAGHNAARTFPSSRCFRADHGCGTRQACQ